MMCKIVLLFTQSNGAFHVAARHYKESQRARKNKMLS